MVKKVIWLGILGAILIFLLPKVFFQLSLLFDQSNDEIQRVIIDDDSGLLLPPEFDTLPAATNSAQIAIHGFSQSAAEVELFINDIPKGKIQVTKPDGSFQIRNVRLYSGENVLTLIAYDKRGNRSAHSSQEVVVYKKDAPKLVISEPVEDAEVRDNTISIVGLTDADADVAINTRWIRVRSDGTFTHNVTLTPGNNEFSIVATDNAGNSTELKRTIRYLEE